MKGIIGIAAVKDGVENIEQLPVARIYITREGEYLFLERTVIDEAITHSLNKLEAGQLSVVLIEVQVVPISQRVTRRKKVERRDC